MLKLGTRMPLAGKLRCGMDMEMGLRGRVKLKKQSVGRAHVLGYLLSNEIQIKKQQLRGSKREKGRQKIGNSGAGGRALSQKREIMLGQIQISSVSPLVAKVNELRMEKTEKTYAP